MKKGANRDKTQALTAYLVVAARDGNRGALGDLVRLWHPRFIAHGWRLTGRREAAEDAVQSAWRDIVRGIAKLRDESAFAPWAYRIVTRAAKRQAGRELPAASPDTEIEDDRDGPEEASRHAELRCAIRALPAGQRAAIALHYFEGLTVAETAVALSIPAGTAKTRLMHARAKLRAFYEGDEK
ncbi:MAG: sigma-70 family RNA polymerase sigma factor [Sphingomonas sp.]|nr:sigma-70 family RNA polymerase sigma factor [Sphingomonas sp.]RZV49865.1 MAG: sigma-70 family RNA polymerase sigma factor [Sphingomonadaceae bacterium]